MNTDKTDTVFLKLVDYFTETEELCFYNRNEYFLAIEFLKERKDDIFNKINSITKKYKYSLYEENDTFTAMKVFDIEL